VAYFRAISRQSPRRTEEGNEENQCHDRDMNQASFEYKSGALPVERISSTHTVS
jgi:hypothetical protein